MSRRARARARSSADRSAAGSETGPAGSEAARRRRKRTGPAAIPGETGRPRADGSPASCRAAVEAAGPAAAPAGSASASASPNPASASARTAPSARAADAPVALTRSSWPFRAPSTATPFRLRALTGPRPAVTFATRRSASGYRPASWTSRIAGRAWSPSRFFTVRRSWRRSPAARLVCPGRGRLGAAAPSWVRLGSSAPRASAAACSSELRQARLGRGRTAPSTSGAAQEDAAPRPGGSRSRAVSALSTAPPRSISTSTPSSE